MFGAFKSSTYLGLNQKNAFDNNICAIYIYVLPAERLSLKHGVRPRHKQIWNSKTRYVYIWLVVLTILKILVNGKDCPIYGK